jgi:ribosomal protein S3AE
LSELGKGRNYSIKVVFRVKDIVDGKGICEAIGYYILNSFARRIVKKGKSKLFESYKLKTKDNINVILKITFVTKDKISRGISRAIRKELSELIKGKISKANFNSVLDLIVSYKFQKSIKESIKKVYPVVSLEVVSFRKVF